MILVIPAIVGLVEVAKRVGMPHRFAPLLAVALGLASIVVVTPPEYPILYGIVYGLTSVGLFSGIKNTVQ